MKKIIIYGFGRMGLTHYAILNNLIPNAHFVFIDPDKKINYFAKKNINAKILSSDLNLHENFDFALICTPPMFHIPLLKKLIIYQCPNIFVEKPFGGNSDDFSSVINTNSQITIGFVLRFNPIIQWVKKYVDISNISEVKGYYFSKTIESKPKGWRNGSYSGVTNEVGSHIIDLFVYLFGLSTPKIIQKKIESIISDRDDILTVDLEENLIKYHLHFDWINKNYRKPVFKFEILMNDGKLYKFDQQKIELYTDNLLINKVTTVDIAQKVDYYLRGVEFTNQMSDFLGEKKIIASVEEALITRNLIKKLLS